MNTQSHVSSHLTSSIQRTRCRRAATPEPNAGPRCHWLLRGPNAVTWRLRVAVQSTRSSVARRYRGSGDARRCATRPPRARPRVSIHRGHRPARRCLHQPVVRAGGDHARARGMRVSPRRARWLWLIPLFGIPLSIRELQKAISGTDYSSHRLRRWLWRSTS